MNAKVMREQKIAEQKMTVNDADNFQRCTCCHKAGHVKEYGEYLNSSEEVMHYVQCIDCRNAKNAWVLRKRSINL